MAFVSWLLQRSFIRIYSKAQIALEETFSQPPPAPESPVATLPPLLREADLASVVVPPHSPVRGKLIRELNLRAKTGASIVGIEREGTSIINPGPDEELRAGDQLLLLGTHAQLESAKVHLAQSEVVRDAAG